MRPTIILRELFGVYLSMICWMSSVENCPLECYCVHTEKFLAGLEVSCYGKSLKQIPQLPPETVSLDMSNNKLIKITTGIFPHLHKLKSLWLDNNRISSIEPYSFRGLRDFDMLSIRKNKQLQQLTRFAFSGVSHLQSLLLNDNNIDFIERQAFDGLSNVEVISLYGNPLRELQLGVFEGLQKIGHLQLPTGITSIQPGAFAGLSDVHELTIEEANLTHLQSETFAGLSDVKHLKFHHSTITSIEAGAFSGLRNVFMLFFFNCKIGRLHADLFENVSNISRLYFTQNHFTKIQQKLPLNLQPVAEIVVFESNDADCCQLDQDHLFIWKSQANSSLVVVEFLRGVICAHSKWLKHQNLYRLELSKLEQACSGELDAQEVVRLDTRMKMKPNSSELYRQGSTSHAGKSINYGQILPLFLAWFILQ